MGRRAVDALARVDLLRDLDESALGKIERTVTIRSFDAGQTVLSHQDDTHDVFFILEGRLRITIYSQRGREVSFRDQEAGESLGELSALDGGPRSASVVALTPATVAIMAATTFVQALREHPPMAEAALRKLTSLVRRLSKRVYMLATPVPERICAELYELGEAHMINANTARLVPPPKHLDLANRLATHREAVSRTLGKLKQAKVVRRGRGELLILDMARLARFADPQDDERL